MSLLKTGLLQLSPESAVIGEVTYYDRGPVVVDRVDRESIAEALGPTSKVPAGYTLCLRYGTMTLLAVTCQLHMSGHLRFARNELRLNLRLASKDTRLDIRDLHAPFCCRLGKLFVIV